MTFMPKYGRLARWGAPAAAAAAAPAPAPLAELSEDRPPIPADWQTLAWPALRALAAGLAPDDAPIRTKADALARIEAELQARAEA